VAEKIFPEEFRKAKAAVGKDVTGINVYNHTIKNLFETMSEEDQEKCKRIASEWNEGQTMPSEVQLE
jgi:hypothetical protein